MHLEILDKVFFLDERLPTSWDKYFFDMLAVIKTKSKDPSTKVSCLAAKQSKEVVGTAFNGFAMGVEDSLERYNDRETKYMYICHSEQNLIALAARNGISLNNCSLYIDWIPCSTCAKMLIQAGFSEIVINGSSKEFNNKDLYERWGKDFLASLTMFQEAGVNIMIVRDLKIYNIETGEITHPGDDYKAGVKLTVIKGE